MTNAKLPIDVGTWKLDPMHSQITFAVRHLGISTIRGSFTGADATVEVRADQTADVDVAVQMSSVHTGDANRDGHLQAPDFFDSAAHPQLTFKATNIELDGDSRGKIHGDLTIRGVTKPVVLATEFSGTGTSPMDQSFRAGFVATGAISRSDFGVSFGIPMVSDQVKLRLDVQLVKQ
jgi:polyisoprenoid-binding protein YceI